MKEGRIPHHLLCHSRANQWLLHGWCDYLCWGSDSQWLQEEGGWVGFNISALGTDNFISSLPHPPSFFLPPASPTKYLWKSRNTPRRPPPVYQNKCQLFPKFLTLDPKMTLHTKSTSGIWQLSVVRWNQTPLLLSNWWGEHLLWDRRKSKRTTKANIL